MSPFGRSVAKVFLHRPTQIFRAVRAVVDISILCRSFQRQCRQEKSFKIKSSSRRRNRCFFLLAMQRYPRGSRHSLLLRKLIATTIGEMLRSGDVTDLTCQTRWCKNNHGESDGYERANVWRSSHN
jgi:hypothetical protein